MLTYHSRTGQQIGYQDWAARHIDADYPTLLASAHDQTRVCTVWIGVGSVHDAPGRPTLFETCVYDGAAPRDGVTGYAAEQDAVEGHRRICAEVLGEHWADTAAFDGDAESTFRDRSVVPLPAAQTPVEPVPAEQPSVEPPPDPQQAPPAGPEDEDTTVDGTAEGAAIEDGAADGVFVGIDYQLDEDDLADVLDDDIDDDPADVFNGLDPDFADDIGEPGTDIGMFDVFPGQASREDQTDPADEDDAELADREDANGADADQAGVAGHRRAPALPVMPVLPVAPESEAEPSLTSAGHDSRRRWFGARD